MQAVTNKYITFNNQIQGSNNNGRMRVHLEESASPSENNNMLFTISLVDGKTDVFYLKPKADGSGRSLNPAKGNKNNRYPTDNIGGNGAPAGISISGIVGVYDAKTSEYGSQWVLEEAIMPPTIIFATRERDDDHQQAHGRNADDCTDQGTPVRRQL
jgi:hypothetical protein